MLSEGIEDAYRRAHLTCCLNRVGSMWTLFFGKGPVEDDRDLERADRRRYAAFFHGMLDRGVNFPPSQFEAAFLSSAHGAQDVAATIEAAREALQGLVTGG